MASTGDGGRAPELGHTFESRARAEEELAKDLAERLEPLLRKFAASRFPRPQSIDRLEALSVSVLLRASRLFNQRHGSVMARFIVVADGVSVKFAPVPGA